jgi:hypothetical protein
MSDPKRYTAVGNGVVRTDPKGPLIEFNPFDPISAAMGAMHQGNLLAAKDARIKQLEAEVDRLTKAGDAFISVGIKMREMIGDHHWTLEFDRVRTDWYFAAKEGKQSNG